MRIKSLIAEDFVNYKNPSMFIGTCFCTWKCCIEANIPLSICQNHEIAKESVINISNESLYQKYIDNSITQSIVIGGLEPMLQFDEVCELIECFRNNDCNDMFVIYTGYYPDEIKDEIETLKKYKNIIIKFGRFIPNKHHRYDDVLGVELASDNQYAERIC
jgi:hypothetical protein